MQPKDEITYQVPANRAPPRNAKTDRFTASEEVAQGLSFAQPEDGLSDRPEGRRRGGARSGRLDAHNQSAPERAERRFDLVEPSLVVNAEQLIDRLRHDS
jgi:hypothetical protein